MSKIYDNTLSFDLTRKYTIFCFKRFYSEFIVVGRENLPKNGAVIFAPNHINALMDALAIHAIVPTGLPVIFLARADIFKKKKIADFLRFAKIMPAFRMRDGMENLGKNNEIFDQCVDVLNHNVALGIMPEGNQGEQRKLRPIVKGIFRIAFAAQQLNGLKDGIKIIPIGVDLGDYVKAGNHIIISIGKPIEISDYMESFAENPVNATNEVRNRLRDDLSKLSLDLATEKYYECFEIATEVANESVLKELSLPDKTVYRFVARQKIARRLIEIEKNEPENIKKLDSLCAEYQKSIDKLKMKTWLFDRGDFKKLYFISDGILLLLTLPIFICGLILNFMPYFAPVFIRKNILKAKEIGFFSSMHFVLGIITFPVFYLLQTVLFCCLINSTWWIVLLFLISQYPLGKWSLKWYKDFVKLRGKIRFKKLQTSKSADFQHTKELRDEIISLIVK